LGKTGHVIQQNIVVKLATVRNAVAHKTNLIAFFKKGVLAFGCLNGA
jgi:hypothetical protein